MNSSSLNLYYIFFTVAECSNISIAAKKLFISQPAISKSISKLESTLNTTLFIRSSRGVKLTSEGKILFEQLEVAFRSIKTGEDRIKQINELGIGELSIGVSTTLCKYILMPYLQSFIHDNPYVKISISCQSTYETIAALENGTLDIGLIGEPDKANELLFYPIKKIQDIFVTTKEYLTHLKEKMDLQQGVTNHQSSALFSNATLLLLNKNNITRQYVDRYMLMEGITAEQEMEISSMDLIIEFTKTGLGIGCVIDSFVEKELQMGSLIKLPISNQILPRKIGFACKKQTNPIINNFMNDFVKTSC